MFQTTLDELEYSMRRSKAEFVRGFKELSDWADSDGNRLDECEEIAFEYLRALVDECNGRAHGFVITRIGDD
jgi:hypothetical protein